MKKYIDHQLPGGGPPEVFHARAPHQVAARATKIVRERVVVEGAKKNLDKLADADTWNRGTSEMGVTVHQVKPIKLEQRPDGSVNAELDITAEVPNDSRPGLGFGWVAFGGFLAIMAVAGVAIYGIFRLTSPSSPVMQKSGRMLDIAGFVGGGAAAWWLARKMKLGPMIQFGAAILAGWYVSKGFGQKEQTE